MPVSIFDKLDQIDRIELTPEAEADLILSAKDGDQNAQLQLLRNYLPLMLSELRKTTSARQSGGTTTRNGIEDDDLRMACIEAFYAALGEWREGFAPRLGGSLRPVLRRFLYDENGTLNALNVPGRTRRKFLSFVSAANGDLTAGRALAIAGGMDGETFDAIVRADAISVTQSGVAIRIEAGMETGDGRFSTYNGSLAMNEYVGGEPAANEPRQVQAEVMVDTQRALAVLNERERQVIGILYGIDGETLSERDAAEATGISRSTLQRLHKSALVKMHAAIG